MTNKSIITLLTIILITIFSITSCSFDSSDSNADQDYILSGYYWMAGDDVTLSEGNDRAAINTYTLTKELTTDEELANYSFTKLIGKGEYGNKVNNYPEQGQRTYYTVTLYEQDVVNPMTYTGTFNVYKISAKTDYPKKEEIFDYYLEEYYILDVDRNEGDTPTGGDGFWTYADPITTKENGAWVYNSKARETMELHYQDGSVRYEWITSDYNDGTQYDHFPIDGDMTIQDAPAATATGMNWSSEVRYHQKIEEWIDYWYRETKEIYGVRYYTESLEDNGKTNRTSLAYERIVSQETEFNQSSSNALLMILDRIFGTNLAVSTTAETLAETVIRYEIQPNNRKTVRTVTKVVPTFGDSFNIEKETIYTIPE